MLRYALIPVVMMTALDHHDPVVMVPAAMPAMVAMLAHFGAGAVASRDEPRLITTVSALAIVGATIASAPRAATT